MEVILLFTYSSNCRRRGRRGVCRCFSLQIFTPAKRELTGKRIDKIYSGGRTMTTRQTADTRQSTPLSSWPNLPVIRQHNVWLCDIENYFPIPWACLALSSDIPSRWAAHRRWPGLVPSTCYILIQQWANRLALTGRVIIIMGNQKSRSFFLAVLVCLSYHNISCRDWFYEDPLKGPSGDGRDPINPFKLNMQSSFVAA